MSRDYKITRKEGEWYNANDWIYYVWEKEDWFNSVNSQELLYKAIQQCKEIDEKSNRKAIL